MALACAFTLACERAPGRAVVAEPEAPTQRVATSAERAAIQRARAAVIRSWRGGAIAGLSKVRRDAALTASKRSARPPEGDAARRATIVFSANNRGEREDCGCKRNPLGGLARRGTMLELARGGGDASKELWGRFGEEPAARLFYVDAGDALFKNTHAHSSSARVIEEEMKKARAVVAGMNELAPDAAVVGSYDLAAGWSRFEELRAKATFPFVSANLRVEGEAPLPSHVVVERAGLEVAFIGITAPRGATSDFHEKVGVELADPVKSYAEAVGEAGGADVVVLLSNAGVAGTQDLIAEFEAAGLRVDAALVSGSGAQTRRPNWTRGVPSAEPNSRGKYVGRADVWVVGEGPLSYANDAPDVAAAAQRYNRAVEGYSSNRAKMLTALAKAFEAQRGEKAEGVEKLQNAVEFARKRVEIVGDELTIAAAGMSPGVLEGGGLGDDWFESTITPVKIELEEQRKVKRAVDAASK